MLLQAECKSHTSVTSMFETTTISAIVVSPSAPLSISDKRKQDEDRVVALLKQISCLSNSSNGEEVTNQPITIKCEVEDITQMTTKQILENLKKLQKERIELDQRRLEVDKKAFKLTKKLLSMQ